MMLKINIIEELNNIPIKKVGNKLGIESLTKTGDSLQGNCPTGHKSTNEICFSINTADNYFHCFHCSAAGDNIGLVELVKNYDFKEAVKWLTENFMPHLMHHADRIMPEDQKHSPEYFARAALYEKVYELGKDLLQKAAGKDALKYLTDERGYTLDKLKQTEWIYFPPDRDIRDHLLKKIPDAKEQIKALSLQGSSGDNFRLAFPYRDKCGRITGFVKRATDTKGITVQRGGKTKSGTRYDSTKGLSKNDLFNLNNCRREKSLLIVEGYPDALYFSTLGLDNVVAAAQGQLSKSHVKGIKMQKVKSVTIAFDNDPPKEDGTITGVENTEKAIDLLMKEDIQTFVVDPPWLGKHKDPDEFVKAEGVDEFKRLVEHAVSGFKWKLYRILKRNNIETDHGRQKAREESLELAKIVNKPTMVEEIKAIVTIELGISEDTFDQELGTRIGTANPVELLPASEYLDGYYDSLGDGTRSLIGIESCIKQLDEATLGLEGITVLAGMPGRGKTTLALQMAFDTCEKNGVPILIYSLEMPKYAIYTKILSRLSKVPYNTILLGGKDYLTGNKPQTKGINLKTLIDSASQKNLLDAQARFGNVSDRFYVVDKTIRDISMEMLEGHINYLMRKHQQERILVIIDHLQIFPIDNYRDLKDKIDKIISEFKGINERTKSPMILISQKNRAGYKSSGVESLMGSAGIEYTADIVLNMVSEYEKKKDSKDDDSIILSNMFSEGLQKIDLVIAKNRYSMLTTVHLDFDGKLSNFEERDKPSEN